MSKKKTSLANRPARPKDLAGESLKEWSRACSELAALGRLNAVDRAMLILYCQIWGINQKCWAQVAKVGPVVKWPNGLRGPSSEFKTYRETCVLLRAYLNDLGLSPAARGFEVDQQDAGDLMF